MKYVRIIPKKTHFIFSRLEKQKGPLWCIDTRFLHGKFAVRASRHSREGRFALQQGRSRNAIRALLQGDKSLSAFLTKPLFCKVLTVSTSLLSGKSCFSGCRSKMAVRMLLNIC